MNYITHYCNNFELCNDLFYMNTIITLNNILFFLFLILCSIIFIVVPFCILLFLIMIQKIKNNV
jgi:hypothetical protein